MKLKTWNFDQDVISIVNLGDVHYGNPQSDRKGFQRVVDMIKDNENMYWVSTGDLLEVALIDSAGDVYNSQSLQTELDELVKILEPISHKCLGIVGSNHHDRLARKTGLNLDQLLADKLNIPYLGYFGFLRVVLNGVGFYISMHHSYGFGRTEGSKANTLAYIGNVVKGFDLYLTGHTHSFRYFLDEDYVLDRKHARVMKVLTHYVCTGHFLNYDGSYAEKRPLKPKPKCAAMVTLFGKRNGKHKEIRVDRIDV